MTDEPTPDRLLGQLDDARPDPQSFAAFLLQHAKGRSETELSAALRDVAEAVEQTGKAGSITYTIKVAPNPNAEHVVTTSDDIKVKLPTRDRPASIFFVDDAYRLVRSDPRQLTFESFREES
jgi:hypothetical protein